MTRYYITTLTSISNADPAVFTLVDHGLYIGDRIRLFTSSSLPSPLVVNTDYYVVHQGLTTSTFELSDGMGGTPIATTSAGAGTHSFMKMNHDGLTPIEEDNR